ncbi:hypothetical protein R3I93_012035 [Phoxinus phoxinus]|uniref:Uncharacterized protein n=1 Tax=Phoxinus phoxinus TaxID=58324 RepID=A0AAN9CXJ2_9TELE
MLPHLDSWAETPAFLHLGTPALISNCSLNKVPPGSGSLSFSSWYGMEDILCRLAESLILPAEVFRRVGYMSGKD